MYIHEIYVYTWNALTCKQGSVKKWKFQKQIILEDIALYITLCYILYIYIYIIYINI